MARLFPYKTPVFTAGSTVYFLSENQDFFSIILAGSLSHFAREIVPEKKVHRKTALSMQNVEMPVKG